MKLVQKLGDGSFYGFTDQTIDSLLLTLVPLSDGNEQESLTNTPKEKDEHGPKCQCNSNRATFIESLIENFWKSYKISLSLQVSN